MTTTTDTPERRQAKADWQRANGERRSQYLRARRRAWGWLRDTNRDVFEALLAAEPATDDNGVKVPRRLRFERANSALTRCVPSREWLLLYERAKREVADEEGVTW